MRGIMIRELRLFLNTPVNVGLSVLTPLLYGFLFAASLSGSIEAVVVGEATMKYLAFVAPGIGVLGLLMFANMCGAGVWQERVSGMLREIASCPISATEYAAGKMIANSGIAMIQGTAVMLMFTMLLDRQPTLAQLTLGLAVMLCGGIALVSLFSTLWALMPSTQTGSLVANIMTMVMLFTSPVFYPISSMPVLLRNLSSLNPLSHIVSVLRAVLFGQALDPAYLAGLIAVTVLLVIINTMVLARSMSTL